MPSCTILIVNWNSWDMLSCCLLALKRQTAKDFHVLVFDNGSMEGEHHIAEFRKMFSCVTFISSSRNLGFAAANNRLLRDAANVEWVALLNPDAFPAPDWFETLMQAALRNVQFDSFASRLMQDGTPELLDGAGDVYHFAGLAWRAGHGEMPAENDAEREVFSPCAAAALFKRAALLDVGGFDEDYFCYYEDVDLGFRLRLAGHRCLYVPQAVVRHVGSGTSGGLGSDFSLYHGHRNLVWTFVKNMPGAWFWALLPAHLMFNLISVVRFSLHGRARLILAAKRDALKGVVPMWRKRRTIQAGRRVSAGQILRLLSWRLLPRLSRSSRWGQKPTQGSALYRCPPPTEKAVNSCAIETDKSKKS